MWLLASAWRSIILAACSVTPSASARRRVTTMGWARRRSDRGSAMSDRAIAEITIDSKVLWAGIGIRAAIVGPIAVVGLIGMLRNPEASISFGIVVGLGLAIGVVAIAMTTVGVRVTESNVDVRRLIGVNRSIARRDIERGVFVKKYEQYGNTLSPMLFFLDAKKQKLLRLSGQTFSQDSLMIVARALGMALFDVTEDPTSGGMLAEAYPGIVPYWERKPVAFVLWSGLWLAAACVVVVVIAGFAGAW